MATNKYRVLTPFKDGEDKDKEYQAGDIYAPSKRISKDRYEALTSVNNSLGRPVLALVEGDGVEKEETPEETKAATTAKK
ncbi:hypothetical protein [Macrococcus bovicus]|uniref:Uncharacterized protein n=1 Tax=Macrococcus bovicus TaxID=69968 RepID=A0A4V3BFT4_9STAP|nr:hypothetical protein [Macrococcus bovicus]TDM15699.1 hypothetical protein ERX55_01975 [Macrococcus bovicus]